MKEGEEKEGIHREEIEEMGGGGGRKGTEIWEK